MQRIPAYVARRMPAAMVSGRLNGPATNDMERDVETFQWHASMIGHSCPLGSDDFRRLYAAMYNLWRKWWLRDLGFMPVSQMELLWAVHRSAATAVLAGRQDIADALQHMRVFSSSFVRSDHPAVDEFWNMVDKAMHLQNLSDREVHHADKAVGKTKARGKARNLLAQARQLWVDTLVRRRQMICSPDVLLTFLDQDGSPSNQRKEGKTPPQPTFRHPVVRGPDVRSSAA